MLRNPKAYRQERRPGGQQRWRSGDHGGHLVTAGRGRTDHPVRPDDRQGGQVGRTPCGIYFAVKNAGKVREPLDLVEHLGREAPAGRQPIRHHRLQRRLLQHARRQPHGRQLALRRLPAAARPGVTLMNRNKLDVVGTQEFQETTQFDYFVAKGYPKTAPPTTGTPQARPATPRTPSSGASRRWSSSAARTFDIPYFNGNIRHVPAVLLREKSTGRTAYFLNVHNPANVVGTRPAGVPRRSRSSATRSSSCARPGARCSSPATSTTGSSPSAR